MLEKLEKIIEQLELVKAKDIAVYDINDRSPFYRYIVICSANSRQSNAAITKLKPVLENDIKNIEGKGGTWILIDSFDTIIHIFSEDNRKYYSLDLMLLGATKLYPIA